MAPKTPKRKVKFTMRTETKNVTVNFGTKDAPREVSQAAIFKIVETSDDILTLLQTEDGAKDVIKSLNYAYDLRVRAATRNSIIEADSGPEKSFNKLVADIVKNRAALGKPVTEEKARAIAKLMQDAE